MKSRQLIDLNKAQIRQSIEEYLRQLDSKVLIDPYMADLKTQLMEVLVQTIGDSSIDDLVVTEVRESSENASLEFVSHSNSQIPRRLVATLRDPAAEDHSNDLTAADHEPDSPQEDTDEHAEPEPKPHAPVAAPKAKTDAHGASPKKTTSHAAPAKKPASSGHGAPASAHGAAASGHGAAKKPAKDAKKTGH